MASGALRRAALRIGIVVLLVLAAAGGAARVYLGRGGNARADGAPGPEPEEEAVGRAIRVKAVHAQVGKDFQMTVQRPADVEAYYSAELESRVPGVVRMVRSAIGDEVKAGELLIDVDVPDLVQAVQEKERVVTQRQKDHRLAVVAIKSAEAAVKTARSNVKVKEAAVGLAEATIAYRAKLLDRLTELRGGARGTIDQGVVDDARRNYDVAVADKAAAVAAVEKAKSEVEDAAAKVEEARALAEAKATLVDVAKSDLELARATRDYAHIKAPFAATVVRRKIDPGDFVQNAATGHPTPLLALERSDIVTVVMRVPDHYAPYVTAGTEAVLELDALPGVRVHGKVTRFAPTLVNSEHDRTMRVEVDLWNRAPEQYNAFLKEQKAKAAPFDDLKKGPLPLLPQFTTRTGPAKAARLLPGQFGTMTLVLKTFQDAHLLPSEAIVSRGGRPYIYVVRGGQAHLQPVEVQVDDGKVAVVELLGENGTLVGNLTGNEVVIVSNQGELSEGQPVEPTVVADWHAAAPGQATR
jgi:multidrug resistance efflux pump